MSRMRRIADIFTAIRPILALYILWLGLAEGAQALPAAALALLAAWVTDLLDGYFSRKDVEGSTSQIGALDLPADLSVAAAVWIYLWMAGFVSPFISLSYLLVAASLLWLTRSAQVGWGIQAAPYGTMIWITWLQARPIGWLLFAWIFFVLVATWPRFAKQTVPEFLTGLTRSLKR